MSAADTAAVRAARVQAAAVRGSWCASLGESELAAIVQDLVCDAVRNEFAGRPDLELAWRFWRGADAAEIARRALVMAVAEMAGELDYRKLARSRDPDAQKLKAVLDARRAWEWCPQYRREDLLEMLREGESVLFGLDVERAGLSHARPAVAMLHAEIAEGNLEDAEVVRRALVRLVAIAAGLAETPEPSVLAAERG